MITNVDLVRRVPLFSTLSREQADRVSKVMYKRQFKRGDFLIRQGDSARVLMVLLTGRAHVASVDFRGRSVILATLLPGDHLGEMSLIDEDVTSANIVAEIPTDCLVIDQAEFAQFLPPADSMAYALLRGYTKRLRHADRKIAALALMDVEGRLAQTLFDTARLTADGSLVIKHKITRQTLAKIVGASREMVGKVMKDFEAQGWFGAHEQGGWYVHPQLEALVNERTIKARPLGHEIAPEDVDESLLSGLPV